MSTLPRLLIVLLLLVESTGCRREPPATLGTVERDRITLPSPVFERIVEIPVREGQVVQPGETILLLESTRTAARLESAQAELQRAQSVLAELAAGARPEAIAEARARVQGAQALARNAEQSFQRVESIVARKLQPESARDAARASRDAATAEVRAAREALALLEHGSRVEQLDQARATVAATQAQLAAATIDSERTRVIAPRSGVIEQLPFEVGDQPAIGAPLAVLLVGSQPHARVYVPQRLRAQVQVGSTASVRLADDPRIARGRVRTMQAEPVFTPYFALSGDDVSHLSWLAEIELDASATTWPVGMPVSVQFDVGTP